MSLGVNFFVSASYIRSAFMHEQTQVVPMNEMRISAGLGFDFDFIRK